MASLGDIAHFALLGTTILGTTQNQFMGLDRWDTPNMDMVYGSTMFQQALGTVFTPVPTIGKFVHNTTWASYGDLDAGKAFTPYYFVLIRGTLQDPSTAQATHDAAVAGAKAMTMAAGDVAHMVYLGRDDMTQVAFIDIWKDSTNIMAVYTNAGFQQAFAALFSGNPVIGVYQSTDWYQW